MWKDCPSFVRKIMSTGFAFSTIATLGLGWSLFESRHPKKREYFLKVLPENSKPIRILHVSDLHYRGKGSAWLGDWLKTIDLDTVDVVVSTGDNLGGENFEDEVLEVLSPLLKKPGVFVFGSNDYYGPKKKNPLKYFVAKNPLGFEEAKGRSAVLDSEKLAEGFRDCGWLDLNNSVGVLDLPHCRLEFVGVDDPHIGRDSMPDVSVLAGGSGLADFGVGVCENGGENLFADSGSGCDIDGVSVFPVVRIGVGHAPYLSVLSDFANAGCVLSCFGHTHGGQLCVPLFGALVSNCDLPPVYASGVFSLREIFDYVLATGKAEWVGSGNSDVKGFVSVSAGLGASPMLPLRFACPPEVSLITLLPA